MLKRVRETIRTATQSQVVREVGITYAGQMAASGIGFALQLFLQREMGPADYGVLGLALSIGSISTVITDLGLSHAMVRFGSRRLAEAPDTVSATLCAGLLMRSALTIVVTLVGYAVARHAAVDFFDKPELVRPLQCVYLTIAGHILFSFWGFAIQTLQRFGTRSLVLVVSAAMRVGLFVSVFLWYQFTPSAVVLVDSAAAFLGFLLGLVLSPGGMLKSSLRDVRRAASELVPYCRFTGILIVGNMLFNELDTLMLGVFATKEVVGLYRAAWTYAMVLAFLNQSVANVLFPKITSISTAAGLREYAWKIVRLTVGLAILTLPAPFIVSWWIPWYEPEYSGAVVVFYIMYVGLIVDMIMAPLGYLLFSLERPGALVSVAALKIVTNFAANLMLIPLYGAVGAAAATLVTRTLGGVLNLYVAARALKTAPGAKPTE